MQFSFVRHAMLCDQFSGHIRQKVRAVENLAFGNQADTSKDRALFVMDTGSESGGIGVEMDADASGCETAGSSNTDYTGIPFNKRQLV